MVLDQDPGESSGQDGHDDGQARVAPVQRPVVIQNAADEPEPQSEQQPQPQSQPQPQPQPIQGPPLEAEPADDADSALGNDDDEQSITTTLADSIRQYRVENGRTYHKYRDGQYPYPNDEAEQDRLDLQHHLHTLTLDGRLYLAPIKQDVQNVLDIGTGTGLWAIEFADKHPSAVVIGTDLSPIQPTFTPPNLSFIVDDANEPWAFNRKFDYIHARELHCTVDEKRFMRQALEHLQPGGWFEMKELALPVRNDDGTLSPDDALYKWSELMVEASGRLNQSLDKPPNYAQWMREAGFVNVQSHVFRWPSNPWPRDTKHKTLGLWSLANSLDGLEGFTMAHFTRVLGWQPEEVQVFLIDVRDDNRNRQKHAYYPVFVTYGQKAEESGGHMPEEGGLE